MDATSDPSRDIRRLDIQGLRAIAVLLVVAFHAGLPFPGGFVGVDVFFVISGFVIAGLLLRELDATGGVDLGRFYMRRMRRLFPALALLVAVVALGSVLFASPFGPSVATAQTGLGAVMFVANAAIYQTTGGYFDAPADTNALLHTWSLSVEEQFYLVFPALLVVAYSFGRRWLRGRGRETAAVVLLLVAAASFALSTGHGLMTRLGIEKPDVFAFYSSPTRAWEFAIGAVLALTSPTIARLPRPLASIAAGVGAVLVLASGLAVNGTTQFPGWATILPVGATVLLIVSGTAAQGALVRALSARPLVWIGDRSYSWYLWHWPLIVLSSSLGLVSILWTTAVAVFSLIPASLSYRYVERPIRTSRLVRGRRMAALVAACVLVPGAVCVAVVLGPPLPLSPDTASMIAQVTPNHVSSGCMGLVPDDQSFDGACTWNAAAPGRPIYLVGDSQADMLSEAVIVAATGLDHRLVISARGDCPFADIDLFRDGQPDAQCQDQRRQTLDRLLREPGVVVVAAGEFTVTGETWAMSSASGGARAISIEDKAAIYRAGLLTVLDQLRASGNRILIVQPVPHFFEGWIVSPQNRWEPSRCPTMLARVSPSRCGAEEPLAEVISNQAVVFDANTEAARAADGSTIDLRPSLCSAGTCATNQGNYWFYKDGAHLTVQESKRLGPLFRDALAPLLGSQP